MSYGVQTFDGIGRKFLDSTTMTGIFPSNTGVSSLTVGIPTNSFSNVNGVSTPIQPFVVDGRNLQESIKVSGELNTNAQNYIQPNLFINSANATAGIKGIVRNQSFFHTFGTPPAPPANDYGFRAIGTTTADVAVDSTHRSFYIHPTSNGQFIRSATVSSLPSVNNTTSYSQTTQPNIFFDQAFNLPPLIFVVSTTGPIAMGFMARNANGQYIGMNVSAESSLTSSSVGLGFFGSNTYSFQYFIASPEPPIFGAQTNYGMQVFNSLGTKVFDSSFFEPSISFQVGAKPTLRLLSTQNYQSTFLNFSKPSNVGVCLNNFAVGSGHTWDNRAFAGQSLGFGIFTIGGRFLSVAPTSGSVKGSGACSFLGFEVINISSAFNHKSYDYTLGSAPNSTLLFATYI